MFARCENICYTMARNLWFLWNVVNHICNWYVEILLFGKNEPLYWKLYLVLVCLWWTRYHLMRLHCTNSKHDIWSVDRNFLFIYIYIIVSFILANEGNKWLWDKNKPIYVISNRWSNLMGGIYVCSLRHVASFINMVNFNPSMDN